MAANYTDLKAEVQNWLDRSDAGLVAAIPTMIEDAENAFNRLLRTWEMECSSTTPLIPNGVVDADKGTYALPADWVGHKTVRIDGTNLHIVYYRKIPALTDQAPTNWLLSKHADLYRHGALVSAESWLKNDPRIELWRNARDRAISEVATMAEREQTSGGPKRIRTTSDRVWEMLRRTDGSLEYLRTHDFFNVKSSGYNKTQMGIRELGYFTIAYGKIHIWPIPGGDETGPGDWSACP